MTDGRHVAAVLLDAGDTLVDEGSQEWGADGAVLSAVLVPGAGALVRALHAEGYPLALVADGPRATFENVLGGAGLLDLFDVLVISGDLGVEKPDPRMFLTALDALGVGPADRHRAVMVGNNLRRDIAGANELGLETIWVDWAPRRRKEPRSPAEVPDHRATGPAEVLDLVHALG